MDKTALITGASAGIGHELSKIFARHGYHLVLVSRNRQRLETLAGEIEENSRVRAAVIAKDLSESSAPQALYDELLARKIDIHVLVNNAGFGTNGKFTDFSVDAHSRLIQLNIASLTILCKLFGTDMVRKRSGKILNVASTAAFQPGPFMSTYYASKAYVLMFSEALHSELSGDGVGVTTLCPGPTKTEFFQRNEMTGTKLSSSPHIMKPADVARAGFEGLMRGKRVVVPGIVNKVLALSVRLFPRSVAAAIAGSLNR